MSKVYQGFQRINGRVTPEIEQVMDRMLIKKGSSNASAGNMYQELKSDTESSREERLAKIQSVIQPDGSIDFASLPQDKAQRKYLLEAAMALARNDKAFSPQNIRETEKDISRKLAAQGITAREIIKAAVLCSPACPSKEGAAQETPSVQAESMTR